jgi:hypothetical protein
MREVRKIKLKSEHIKRKIRNYRVEAAEEKLNSPIKAKKNAI